MNSYLFAASMARQLDTAKFKLIPDGQLKEFSKCLQDMGQELGDASLLLLLLLDSPPEGMPQSTLQAIQKSFGLLLEARSKLKYAYERTYEGFFDAQLFEPVNNSQP